jgi:alpha-mannosidase
VSGNDLDVNLVKPAWEARMPCLTATGTGPGGTLAPSREGITLSRSGVLVTALGPNPDGSGTLLRLWEQAGQQGPCRVRLPAELMGRQVQPCDLRGRPSGEMLPVSGGEFEVDLPPFAPLTVLLF